MSGRKSDVIWNYFDKLKSKDKTGCRAKCKTCGKELQGLVSRLKKHYSSHNTESSNHSDPEAGRSNEEETDNLPSVVLPSKHNLISSQPSTQQKISHFVMKTTATEKSQIDEQIARFLYATNTSFNSVEHPEFVKMVQILRPGYSPPNRQTVGEKLLNDVYVSIEENIKKELNLKYVCMALDGWSNIHNEPIVCVSVMDATEGSVYLTDTIDTSGHSHTAEYLADIAKTSINSCKKRFGCKVGSFVTDNTANVKKMREIIKGTYQGTDPGDSVNLITYGCSAHILNLLAKDVTVPGCKEHILQVIKYFRNVHIPAARYREAGGSVLQLPSEVRWNSLVDSLESYIKNWPILIKVCEENRSEIDTTIMSKIKDFNLKRNAEDVVARLKPIAVALDRAQRNDCKISDCVELWKVLIEDLSDSNQPESVKKKAKERESMALTPPHLLANILDPRYRGKRLTQEEKDSAMRFAQKMYPYLLNTVIQYRAKASPFSDYMFEKSSFENLSPLSWWMCFGEHLDKESMETLHQLFSASASTAGVERIFSSFGFVHSKTRNRLGTEKAAKLVTVFKHLNRQKNLEKKRNPIITFKEKSQSK